MNSNWMLGATALTALAELVTILLFRASRAQIRKITDSVLDGRDLDSLDELTRKEIEDEVYARHYRTIYRKLELACICFQLPGLASWGIITGKNESHPLYCMTVSFLFWISIVFAIGYYTS